MSLGVSTDNNPLLSTRLSKPIAAHRKRASMSANRGDTSLVMSPSMEEGGVLGGLRERSEDELQRASREEMEAALREEWVAREQLLERLNALEADQRNLQSERNELSKAVTNLQGRVSEAFNDQHRLEADLESRDEVMDRLRARVGEGERAQRDLQRRYSEQEKSFDAEREAFRAQESQLQSRVNSLLNRLDSPPAASPDPSPCAADEELDSLRASHSTLLARLNTLSREMNELKTRNAQLEEDNAGWEFLMRERTMSGKVLEGGLFHIEEPVHTVQERKARRKSRKSRGELEKLDEEMELEEEMEDLHSDLEMQSPILGDDAKFTSELCQVDGMLAPPATGRRFKGESLGDLPVTGSGLDLASELGRAEVDGEGETRVLAKGDEGEAIRAELKQVREANKALTLYCSKIIDRIIAQEGFEQILSVDYKTRRGLRVSSGSSSASSHTARKAKARPSLKDITQSTQDANVAHAAQCAEEPKKEKKTRPLSMMFRSNSSLGTENVEAPKEEAKALAPAVAPTEETKAEKRARRGFSLDLRSFGFGTTPIESPKPRLKPLALSNRTSTLPPASKASSSASVTPASSLGHSNCRKLDVEEEDEDDRRERHRMEASLKLMGIDRSPSPSAFEEPSAGGGFWGGMLGTSSPRNSSTTDPGLSERGEQRSSASSADSEKRGTPLMRLAERLGGHSSPLMEGAELDAPVTEESASKALEHFDRREREESKALAKGKKPTEFTSPARPTRQHVGGKVPKSESISTLWSMGSGSRPGSREVAPGELQIAS